MISYLYLWFLLLPILIGILLVWFLPKTQYNYKVSAVYTFVTSIVIVFTLAISVSISHADVEIWNGQVSNKVRTHDEYTRYYECFCTSDSKGNRACQMCSEQRYTVSWDIYSTVGAFNVDKLDTASSLVYLTPDPKRFIITNINDPVSVKKHYINYVQAVPNGLFTPSSNKLKEKFKTLIPTYPDTIYDMYKNDHVLSPGHNLRDLPKWNAMVANELRTLGTLKQINLIFVIARTNDPNYEYAIRDAWENGNKNDVIVVIGSENYPVIDFVRIITWSKKELFKVELRDAIFNLGSVNDDIIHLTVKQINKNFERRHMSEFKYLEDEIALPFWLLLVLFCVVVVMGIFSFYKFGSR